MLGGVRWGLIIALGSCLLRWACWWEKWRLLPADKLGRDGWAMLPWWLSTRGSRAAGGMSCCLQTEVGMGTALLRASKWMGREMARKESLEVNRGQLKLCRKGEVWVVGKWDLSAPSLCEAPDLSAALPPAGSFFSSRSRSCFQLQRCPCSLLAAAAPDGIRPCGHLLSKD